MDELLDKARQTFDQSERQKLYSEVQRLLVVDLPMLPLFFSVEHAAIRDNVHGFEWIADQIPRCRDQENRALKRRPIRCMIATV